MKSYSYYIYDVDVEKWRKLRVAYSYDVIAREGMTEAISRQRRAGKGLLRPTSRRPRNDVGVFIVRINDEMV